MPTHAKTTRCPGCGGRGRLRRNARVWHAAGGRFTIPHTAPAAARSLGRDSRYVSIETFEESPCPSCTPAPALAWTVRSIGTTHRVTATLSETRGYRASL